MCPVAPVLGRMEKSRNLVEGDSLELECSSWGWPTPNMTWRRQDAHSGVESDPTATTTVVSEWPSRRGGGISRLEIRSVALTDYSKYVCVAANSLGSINATILVRVKGQTACVLSSLSRRRLRLRFDRHSTAVRLRYDHSTTYITTVGPPVCVCAAL